MTEKRLQLGYSTPLRDRYMSFCSKKKRVHAHNMNC